MTNHREPPAIPHAAAAACRLPQQLFPTCVRYTGFALSFNCANALLGGTAPFVATWLIAMTGSTAAPAWYLTAIAVGAIGAIGAMYMAKETAFTQLSDR